MRSPMTMVTAASLREQSFIHRAIGWCLTGVLVLGCMTQAEGDEAEHRQAVSTANVHASIRRVGTLVEVELTADELAKPTSMPPVLVIGDAAFGRSRHPSDGRTDTRIFMIDAAEFDALPDDAEMTVGHLSPAARLKEPAPIRSMPGPSATSASASAAGAASPRIRPDQVQSGRRRIGALRNDKQDVLP
jgi:hypothetical protein